MGDVIIGESGMSFQRYVNVLSDAEFKAVFGDRRNKNVLINFLNVVLQPHRYQTFYT